MKEPGIEMINLCPCQEISNNGHKLECWNKVSVLDFKCLRVSCQMIDLDKYFDDFISDVWGQVFFILPVTYTWVHCSAAWSITAGLLQEQE